MTALPAEHPGHRRQSTRGPGEGVTGQRQQQQLWFPVKFLRQERKFDFKEVPSHSGTAAA